jgi:hypothetical protein
VREPGWLDPRRDPGDPQELAELQLQAVGAPYAFQRGKLHNLQADRFIKGHGDVTGNEVVYATLTAIAGSG